MRLMAYSLCGFLLTVTLLTLAVTLLFTPWYFELKNLHPATLNLMDGTLTAAQLRATNINGFFLTWPEVHHLVDVANVVQASRWALLVLMPVLLGTMYLLRTQLLGVLLWAWGTLGAGTAVLTGLWLTNGWHAVSWVMHDVFFAEGTWFFMGGSLITQLYPRAVMIEGLLSTLAVTCFVLLLLSIRPVAVQGRSTAKAGTA